MSTAKIIYTITDEAPALATYSLLPIVQGFTRAAGRRRRDQGHLARGPHPGGVPRAASRPGQRQSDDLAELGELAKTPEANIIKLPNISASMPQLKAAIKELQQQGYAVPDYPEDPQNDADKAIKARYAKVLGSAVNPVLREGNSDRRVAASVKQYAKSHPHSMGAWSRGLEVARLVDERRRLLRQRAVGRRSPPAGKLSIEFPTPRPAARACSRK